FPDFVFPIAASHPHDRDSAATGLRAVLFHLQLSFEIRSVVSVDGADKLLALIAVRSELLGRQGYQRGFLSEPRSVVDVSGREARPSLGRSPRSPLAALRGPAGRWRPAHARRQLERPPGIHQASPAASCSAWASECGGAGSFGLGADR